MRGHPCPCCGFLTRTDEAYGTFDICPVCGWEDDNVQARDPDYRGGANKESLNEAREMYRTTGKCDTNIKVRDPLPNECPDDQSR